MEEQLQPAKSELANLNFKDLFFKYVRFLPLIILSVALALLVVWVYLRYATLVYQSTGSIVLQDDNNRGGSNERLDQLMMSDGQKNVQREIEVLRSRPLMERVVRRLNLQYTYLAQGNIKELNVYNSSPFRLEAFELTDSSAAFTMAINFVNEGSFRVDEKGAAISFGQVFRHPRGVFRLARVAQNPIGQEYKVIYQPRRAVASSLVSKLTVAPKANTGILILTLQATNPRMAADVINSLMQEYQLLTVEEKNITNQQTLAFIDSRLAEVQSGLDSITTRQLSYQTANNLIDFDAQSTSYFNRIQEADQQLNLHRGQLEMAELIERYLRDRRNNFTRAPSPLGLADLTLVNFIAAYNIAQLERAQMVEDRVPAGNVLLQQKEQQIEELRTKILESLGGLKASITAAIGNLRQESGEVERQIRSLPVKQQNLIEIERDKQSKEAVYNYLMEKREESAIALASTISDTRVLEEALPNNSPVKPDRRNAQLLAVVIGILIPAVIIFVMEVSNDKVTTRNDIEKITSAAILGEVGHSYKKDALVVTGTNRSVVAEQFRIIRSNMQYVLHNIPKPVILITSSFSGEGKSFISTNVGAVMALTGKKTIILEFDIRKPRILSELHMTKKPGLTNYLLGKLALEELPIPVEGHTNLFVLACGPIPPNPSELLLEPALNDLFVYLRQNFDVVIMDTAPVGMVSDALTLSRFADATLYIVRQGHTYKRQIALLDEFHTSGKMPKISIVLNDVKLRSGYGYYGYGRYGYGYGYGEKSGYYEEEVPPPGFIDRWFGWLDIEKWKKKRNKKNKSKKSVV